MYRLFIPRVKPSVREIMIKSHWAPGLLRYKQVSASGFPRHPLLSYFYVTEITTRARAARNANQKHN